MAQLVKDTTRNHRYSITKNGVALGHLYSCKGANFWMVSLLSDPLEFPGSPVRVAPPEGREGLDHCPSFKEAKAWCLAL